MNKQAKIRLFEILFRIFYYLEIFLIKVLIHNYLQYFVADLNE